MPRSRAKRRMGVGGVALIAAAAACGLDAVGLAEGVETSLGDADVAEGDAGCGDACAPSVPTGWTAASIEPAAACPAGTTGVAVVEGPEPAACSCTCGAPTVNPCTQGSDITLMIGGLNTVSCGGGNLTVDVTGGCDAFRSNGAAIGSLSCNSSTCQYVGAPALQATAPQACAVTQNPSVTSAARATLCTGTGECMTQAGDLSCPAGFPTKHLVHAESEMTDTRVCSGCACATTTVTCGAPTITLYTSAACQGTAVGSGSVTGSCVFIADSINGATHFRYASAAQTSCAPTATSTVTSGTFDAGPPITVCCR